MKKSKFSEEKIVAILKKAQSVRSICRNLSNHGIIGNTFYLWKKKCNGVEGCSFKKMW